MGKSEFSQEAGPNSEQYLSNGPMTIYRFDSSKTAKESYRGYLELVEQFESEMENQGSQLEEIHDRLQHFITKTVDNPRDLKQKLMDGGFSENYYNRIKSMKEKYSMDIVENDLSFSASKIHGFLLAEVTYRFQTHIYPFIDKEIDKVILSNLIDEKVVNPVYTIVSQKNILDITKYDIMCMVYFLTGNCHINWN